MAPTILQMCDNMLALVPSLAGLQPEGIGFKFPPSESKPSADLLGFLRETRRHLKTSLYPKDEDLLLLNAMAKKAGLFLTTAMKCTDNRQLYVTEEGFVGLGPIAMKEGIRIVYVGDTPLIFAMRERKKQGVKEYEMLGETYLHGFMNGEVAMTAIGDMAGDIVIV